MSTDSGLTGDGGLDTGAVPGVAEDVQRAESLAAPAEPTATEEAPDWREGLDDDLRKYVEDKGYKDPGAIVKSGREAEREMNRLREENKSLDQALFMLYEEQQKAQAPADDTPKSVSEELSPQLANIAQRIEAGEVPLGEGIYHAVSLATQQAEQGFEKRLSSQLEKFAEERINPLNDDAWNNVHRRKAAEMNKRFGEDYQALAPRAKEIMEARVKSDPNSRYDENAIDVAFGQALMEQRETEIREARAQTLSGTGAGGTGRDVDPVAAIMDPIEAVTESVISNGGIL